jgi:hypothetical protein
MTDTGIEPVGSTQASKLIRVRDGGIVAISRAPWGAAGRPMTALHVHGYEGLEELSDAEVHLEVDELARLVRELGERLPDEQRLQVAQILAHSR